MSKLFAGYDGPDLLAFHCPGCGFEHCVTVNGRKNASGATWTWNGDADKPTFSPSVNCNAQLTEHQCHFFVRDGMIQFLSDCHHLLKGQTVEMPEWEE